MVTTVYPPTFTPTGMDEQEPTPIKVGFAFEVTSDLVIDGIKFPSPTAQSHGYVQLWRDTDVIVVDATYADFAIGDNFVPFAAPVTLTPGHTYIAVGGTDTASAETPFHYQFSSGWHGETDGPVVIPDPPAHFVYGLESGVSSPPNLTGNANYGVAVYASSTGPTTITVTSPSPLAAATGDTVQLVATPHDGAGTQVFAWTQTSGSTVELTNDDTATASFVPTEAGIYGFHVAVTDDTGTATADVTVNVSAPTPVSVTASSPVSGYVDQAIPIPATPHNGSGAKTWATTVVSGAADIAAGGTSTPLVTVHAAGVAVVRITVTDTTGSAHVDVTVDVAEAPSGLSSNELMVKANDGAPVSLGYLSPVDEAQGVVFVDEYRVDGQTDDTPAFRLAFEAAAQMIDSGAATAVDILAMSYHYVWDSPTIKGGDSRGNAQVPLPFFPSTGPKAGIRLIGRGNPAMFLHWNQEEPQLGGATVIETTLTGLTSDPEWMAPSMIGGPTVYTDVDGPGFSNLMFGMEGILLVAPYDPGIIGVDALMIAEVNIPQFGAIARAAAAPGSDPSIRTMPENDLGVALRMPGARNNARSQVGAVAVEGWWGAVAMSEHFVGVSVNAVYCHSALYMMGSGSLHANFIGQLLAEGCHTIVDATALEADTTVHLEIASLDSEWVGTQYHVRDPHNALYGTVKVWDIYTNTVVTEGAAHLHVENARVSRGPKIAPPVPTSGVGFTNPFWRDSIVVVTGGTVTKIEVDGQDQGITSGPILVPTGKQVRLTYSVAPNWSWSVL